MRSKITWQKYDGLETAMSKVSAQAIDFMQRANDIGVNTDEVMEVLQKLNDEMRQVKKVAYQLTFKERGWR